ncbi:MAG: cytochrome c biogenesis protein CcsA, partial [Candidatus Bathyarchaeota archaeon]|nr:cytochrome c biogenesis protein CcsA [Candidatus Bathyarchaeota archaeon]
KLYASWASNGGSWLFFAFVFGAGYLIIRMLLGENKEQHSVYQFFDVVFLFMILILIIQNPVESMLFTPTEGMGLNPLLKTPWMLIHPPVVFIGYALALYAFGFTFSQADSKPRLTRAMAALAWLFLTFGIALGALWAYEVLGWGGYWAWDPVETSSLVPWLTLTAYFHLVSQMTSAKSTSKDFMLLVTGALIIFASAVTRGGLAVSVHAFGASPIGYVLLLLMGITIVYYLVNKSKKGWSYFEFEINTDTVYNTALSMSFISIIMIAVISLWGIIFPIINSGLTGGDVSLDAAFFNKWAYPFVLLFLAGLIGCHFSEVLDMKKYSATLFGAVLLGFGGVIMEFPTSNMLVNLGLPITTIAGVAVLYNLINSLMKKRSAQVHRSFLHLGIVIVMLGILLSSTNEVNYGELVANPGDTLDLGEVELSFGEFTGIEPTGEVIMDTTTFEMAPEYAGLVIPVTVTKGDSVITKDVSIMIYSAHGVLSRPTIIRAPGYDVYLVLHPSTIVYRALSHQLSGAEYLPEEFVISVIYFPLMNLIWLGTLIMCIGIFYPITKMRKPSVE